jgi:hypothetical protein
MAANSKNTEQPLRNNLDSIKNIHEGKVPQLGIVDSQGEEQLFVLKRQSDTGVLMAFHESHRSHSSHSSHRSHYSSR